MKSYNFLWIDDKIESSKGLDQLAKMKSIHLTHFETHKGGMEELQKSVDSYDAVILDALGYNESTDESEEIIGLHQSLRKLSELSPIKKMPYCIYSGYTEKDVFEAQKMALPPEVRVFKKDGPESAKKMLAYLSLEADKQLDTQIRHENERLFNVLEAYGAENTSTVLQIFRAIKTGGGELNDQLYFTPLRMILEQMFRKANEIGLLHDKCVTVGGNKVNLTESSKFLAGKDCEILKIGCTKSHFPKLIADHVMNILSITGAASHTSKVDVTQNIDIQNYRKEINTPFLLYHLLFMLSDVLIWFDQYSASNQDVDENKMLWEDLEYYSFTDRNDRKMTYKWVKAEVAQIANNGWATLNLKNPVDSTIKQISVYKDMVSDKMLSIGDEVKVIWDSKNPQSKDIKKL